MFSNFSKVVAIFFKCLQNASNSQKRGLPFVSKDQNPPNAPQIRPIERFWALLKNLVYEGNWVAKNREQLIRRIKWAMTKFDQTTIVKMFDNLPDKIRSANVNGLNTVL